MADSKPGIRKITLAGVTLWERGEGRLSDAEHRRRMRAALNALHEQTGTPLPPEAPGQGYVELSEE